MAWVEKRPAGWFVRWRDAAGEKGREGPYGSKGDAESAAKEFESRVPAKRRGRPSTGPRPVAPLTIAQIVALWRTARMDDEERMQRPGAQIYLDDTVRRVTAIAEGWKLPDRPARPADVTVAMAKLLRKRDRRTSANVRAVLRWARGNIGTPLDPLVDEALKPPPSRKEHRERASDRLVKAALARARRHGQMPLVSCLAVYGWRPITACRANVEDVDLKGARIKLHIKHDGEPWWHPLFLFHVEMLRPLVDGREPGDPLFAPPRLPKTRAGTDHQLQRDRWVISAGGSAGMMAVWFRRNLGIGTKPLKKFAISRMRSGAWPWARPLDRMDVRLYTGQKSDEIVGRYEQTNLDLARAFMAQNARGQIGGR